MTALDQAIALETQKLERLERARLLLARYWLKVLIVAELSRCAR